MLLVCSRSPRSKITARITRSALQGAARTPFCIILLQSDQFCSIFPNRLNTGELANISNQTAPMSVSRPQNWYCLKTKPRLEIKAQITLNEIGIETFLPLIRNHSHTPNFHCCLFPSYIFGFFNADEFLADVKRAYGISYVVTCGDEPVSVPGEIIEEIKLGMDGGFSRPDSLQPGDNVIVTSGPFAELRGVFHREISGTERAVILLRALQSARIELSRFDLRREI